LVAVASWPLQVMAANPTGIVRPERVFAIILVAAMLGMGLIWLLTRAGVEPVASQYSVFVALVFAMCGGTLLRGLGGLGVALLIVCPLTAGWLFTRFERSYMTMALVWGTVIALASGPVITLTQNWPSSNRPSLVRETETPSVELVSKPDIFLIVVDGYPGAIAARQDGLSSGLVDIRSHLAERGFEVPESTWSSYWTTVLSVSSLMEMEYPVEQDGWRDVNTSRALVDIISGNSAAVEILEANGYETYMVESGWSGESCGAKFDHCVPSPLLDEATNLILRRTVAWSFLDDTPGPYVLGALAAFDWIMESGTELSKTPGADFVFTHVVSPHPPLLLRPDCRAEYVPTRAGGGFNVPGVAPELREAFLVEQIDCLDSLMIEFADHVDPEDVVIYVSDHGTDRRYQANPDMVAWDRAATVERLNNFLAVRLPVGCEVGEGVVVPNVLRTVLNCLSDRPALKMLPERMWVNPMAELDTADVDGLLNVKTVSG
jgi:hypothetical protein